MPDYREWRDQNRTLDGLGGFYYGDFNLSPNGGEPERVQGAYITSNLFNVLKVSPALGRFFTPEEDQFGRHRVVLLSHGLCGSAALAATRKTRQARDQTRRRKRHSHAGVMPRGLPFFDNVP